MILLVSVIALRTKYRKELFLLLSLLTMFLGMYPSVKTFLLTAAWILFPYLNKKITNRKIIIIPIIILGFIMLNQYTWIVPIELPMYLRVFGLSYIVFRQIDYLFYEGEYNHSLFLYLSYLLSFYSIVAGPIQRYEAFSKTLLEPSDDLDNSSVLNQINRIVNGYLKVFLISALLHNYADSLFLKIPSNPLLILPFAFVNMAYIYFNFSGYCDVVIAFARLANFELPENFNKPYLAHDINDFWNRQHISLTQWITDYIFVPLSYKLMSIKIMSFNTAQYITFFITFLIAGLWHGTNLNYLVYGLLQGLGVCLVKAYNDFLKKKFKTRKKVREFRKKKSIHFTEIVLTQTYIAFSFIFIAYDSISLLGGII